MKQCDEQLKKSQNINSVFNLQAERSQPPRELANLLHDLPQTETWLLSFRNYLTSNQHTLAKAHLLDFVVDCQTLLNDSPTSYDPQLRQLLYQTYFAENCLKPVNLANKVLRDQLYETLNNNIKDESYSIKEVMRDVRAASRDYKVWKGGLELAYQDYIASKPTPAGTTPIFTAATTVLISLL